MSPLILVAVAVVLWAVARKRAEKGEAHHAAIEKVRGDGVRRGRDVGRGRSRSLGTPLVLQAGTSVVVGRPGLPPLSTVDHARARVAADRRDDRTTRQIVDDWYRDTAVNDEDRQAIRALLGADRKS